MNLTEHERTSTLWLKIVDMCNARLDELRRRNDNDHSDAATAKLRGRIAEIKEFLAAGEPPREVVADAD